MDNTIFSNIILHREFYDENPHQSDLFNIRLNQVYSLQTSIINHFTSFQDRTFVLDSYRFLLNNILKTFKRKGCGYPPIFFISGKGKTHFLIWLYHIFCSLNSGTNKYIESLENEYIRNIDFPVNVITIDGADYSNIPQNQLDEKSLINSISWQIEKPDGLKKISTFKKSNCYPNREFLQNIIPNESPCLFLFDNFEECIFEYQKNNQTELLFHFIENLFDLVLHSKNKVIIFSDINKIVDNNNPIYRKINWLSKKTTLPNIYLYNQRDFANIINRRIIKKIKDPSIRINIATKIREWIENDIENFPFKYQELEFHYRIIESYPFHPSVISFFDDPHLLNQSLSILSEWISYLFLNKPPKNKEFEIICIGDYPLKNEKFLKFLIEFSNIKELGKFFTPLNLIEQKTGVYFLDKYKYAKMADSDFIQKILLIILFHSLGENYINGVDYKDIFCELNDQKMSLGIIRDTLYTLDELFGDNQYIQRKGEKFVFNIN